MDKQLSYRVGEWCKLRKISRAQFYQLDKKGLGPESYTAGRGRYISAASDRRWEERMEELERERKEEAVRARAEGAEQISQRCPPERL